MKAANPAGRNWFQLYVMRDREVSYELVRRAAAAGFDTLFFTVDAPVAGARLRDKRNGFSIPPQITLGTVLNAIPRPWWWWDFLTTPKLEFASLTSTGGTVGELLDAAMDPTHQLQGPRRHPRPVAGQARRQGRAERRGLPHPRRPRRGRDRAVQPRRPAARPRAGPLLPAARGGQGGRRPDRDRDRHRHHERRRHRRRRSRSAPSSPWSAAPTCTA